MHTSICLGNTKGTFDVKLVFTATLVCTRVLLGGGGREDDVKKFLSIGAERKQQKLRPCTA